MKSPIKNKINLVFIPVTDIQKAKEWYTMILGLEDGEDFFEHLFVAKMDGAGMILDTMPMWKDESGEVPRINVPVIQFGTDDISAAYDFMMEYGVEIVTEVMNEQFFVFKDPDGNLLMVCQD
ncbi:VOC family protein [Robertmurraya kyonggiensis]|uniref:VOC family protein n=1 Tax=Robertmurraya kyonggiensis TaxID=1037680 RepID=A0A4V5P517_9BACI|nr:VOC family protein [Robertmurraya kyonggiensis]TKC18900.1 VOC family protein [Robertmurraya kyonggiensis]